MKKTLKKLLKVEKLISKFDAEVIRDSLVQNELKSIEGQTVLLDAGCGNQKYRSYCDHLIYKTQDLGEYVRDEKVNISKVGEVPDYEIGALDYKGNIWEIEEASEVFDTILCTEVFEHIPYPIETLMEFSRLLKAGGRLIITFPSASNRHFDPHYYYSGFSDRWIQHFFSKSGFKCIEITPIGDYFSYVLLNLYTIAINSGFMTKIFLAPAIWYLSKLKKNEGSINYQCNGYFITAVKA